MRSFLEFRIIICASVFLFVGCANTENVQHSKIAAFQDAVSYSPKNQIRINAIMETARSVGAQAGLAWRGKQLDNVLNKQKNSLNQVYNFQLMMLDNNVMPPVLEESTNTLNLADNSTIRLADREYKIVSPARFVTTVPNWRDYLWMNFSKPETPNASLLPKNNSERDIWNKYVTIGWNDGIKQADEIYAINLNRLTRDYQGIILYRKLLAQNIVSPPFISRSELGVTGGGDDMRVGDRVLRITAMSRLKPNSKLWIARLHGKDLMQSMPTKPYQPVSKTQASGKVKAFG